MAAAMSENSLVLVTGASGYVGSYVTKLLLEAGYKVRATTRDLEKEDKVKFIKELVPEAKHPVEVIAADLGKEDTWKDAVKDVTHVVHCAAPGPHTPGLKEEELTKTMLDGTKALLTACSEAGSVKRFVLTSSIYTVYDQSMGPIADRENDKAFTEEDWTDVEKVTDVYAKVKTVTEKAAWDLVKELAEDKKFQLVSLNPALCVGPPLAKSKEDFPASVLLVKRFMDKTIPLLPASSFAMVDVRDVAQAHVTALECEGAADNRHILLGTTVSLKEMAAALAKEFKPQGYSISTTTAPPFLAWVNNIVDKSSKVLLAKVYKSQSYDNTRMKDVLQITPKDITESLVETAKLLIELGIVKKSKKMRKQESMAEEAAAKQNGEHQNGDAKENGDSLKEEAKENNDEKEEEKKTDDVKVNGKAEKQKENGDSPAVIGDPAPAVPAVVEAAA